MMDAISAIENGEDKLLWEEIYSKNRLLVKLFCPTVEY
jgi:hypothetical protein